MQKKNEINLFEDELRSLPKEKIQAESKALEKHTRQYLKRVIESLLFASSKPLSLEKIREIIETIHPIKPKTLLELLQSLKEEYLIQQRAFHLAEIAEGYILRSAEEFSPYIDKLYQNKRLEKISPAATEVLAIIAYRQPITRFDIEAIRGVDSSGCIQSLLERQLIVANGKLEAPGRPTLYGTTKEFLLHFGIKDLSKLPALSQNNR